LSFLLAFGHSFPGCAVSANKGTAYVRVFGRFKNTVAGDRIRGSSLMVTIWPVLHTGQMHGFTPVSLAKRSKLVSGGCCRFPVVSIIPGKGTALNGR